MGLNISTWQSIGLKVLKKKKKKKKSPRHNDVLNVSKCCFISKTGVKSLTVTVIFTRLAFHHTPFFTHQQCQRWCRLIFSIHCQNKKKKMSSSFHCRNWAYDAEHAMQYAQLWSCSANTHRRNAHLLDPPSKQRCISIQCNSDN